MPGSRGTPVAPAGPAAAGPAGGGPLSRPRILTEALALVDREGSTALTMRKLGAALGVEAMSLYHHVRGREDLLDGVAEVMVADLPVAGPDQDWDEAVRAFAVGIRRIALQHPAAFQLVGLRPLSGGSALRPIGALLLRLRAAGMSPATAVAAYRLTAAFARGFALAEIAGFTLASSAAVPGGAGPADGTAKSASVGTPATEPGPATVPPVGLPPELAEFGGALAGPHDPAFAAGLEMLLAGMAPSLTRSGSAPTGPRRAALHAPNPDNSPSP